MRKVLFFLTLLNLSFFLQPAFCEEIPPLLAKAREKMIEIDLKQRDITDPAVIAAMKSVPRHKFVPEELINQSYGDHPIPIGYGQTISQPYIVALMTQYLKIKPNERVLEVGTGSGYQAAVLAELTNEVYSIEIIPELAKRVQKYYNKLNYTSIKVKNSDGYFGWEEYAPFDAIIITCAVEHIPPPLISQLKEGGRLILPLGSTTFYQTLTLIKKIKGEKLDIEYLSGVAFVPMTGKARK